MSSNTRSAVMLVRNCFFCVVLRKVRNDQDLYSVTVQPLRVRRQVGFGGEAAGLSATTDVLLAEQVGGSCCTFCIDWSLLSPAPFYVVLVATQVLSSLCSLLAYSVCDFHYA